MTHLDIEGSGPVRPPIITLNPSLAWSSQTKATTGGFEKGGNEWRLPLLSCPAGAVSPLADR